MRFWILLLFDMNAGAARSIQKIEREIERIALNPFGNTAEQYESILELSEKKLKLMTLRYYYRRAAAALCEEEAFLLTRFAGGFSVSDLAGELGLTRSSVYKKILRCYRVAESALISLGLTGDTLERRFGGLGLVRRRKEKLGGKLRARTA